MDVHLEVHGCRKFNSIRWYNIFIFHTTGALVVVTVPSHLTYSIKLPKLTMCYNFEAL